MRKFDNFDPSNTKAISNNPFSQNGEIIPDISEQIHEQIIISIIQVKLHFREHQLFSSLFFLLIYPQYCDEAQISIDTLFFANTYINDFLKQSKNIKANELPLTAMCCIWTAVEFHETKEYSDNFNIQVVYQALNKKFSVDEILAAKNEIQNIVQPKQNYSTPFQYIEPFFQGFPQLKLFKIALPDMITLAISFPKLSLFSGEDLFYGTFLACLKIKKHTLNWIQQAGLALQIKNKEIIEHISAVLVQEYLQISQNMDGPHLPNSQNKL